MPDRDAIALLADALQEAKHHKTDPNVRVGDLFQWGLLLAPIMGLVGVYYVNNHQLQQNTDAIATIRKKEESFTVARIECQNSIANLKASIERIEKRQTQQWGQHYDHHKQEQAGRPHLAEYPVID